MMLKVYVAGPMTFGDPSANMRKGMKVGMLLWERHFLPHVPHLTHFWDMVCPAGREVWLRMDLEELKGCDALFRIPGKSPGADWEEERARERGIPVFYTIKALQKWRKVKEELRGG